MEFDIGYYNYNLMEDDRETIIDEYFEIEDDTETICYEDLKEDFNIHKLENDLKDISIIENDDSNDSIHSYDSFQSLMNSFYENANFDLDYNENEIGFGWNF